MYRQSLILFFIWLSLSSNIACGQNADFLKYIDQYKDLAILEMERTGIPASIKLAQGLLESNAGKSTLARKAKNHFGMKCGSSWNGRTHYREDDDYDANGKLIKSCFRAYRDVKSCYVAHSEFLRDPKKAYRYGFLFRLDPKDYKAWARGLKKAGYATSATYADGLIRIIESYKLNQYDSMSSANIDPGTPPTMRSGVVLKNNDVRMVITEGGESPREIADKYDVKLKCVMRYNELLKDTRGKLAKDTRIYIQKKKKSFRGKKKYHYVKKGESMYSIAQDYGIQLGRLYRRNRLEEGTEPAVGERIKIRGWKIRKKDKIKLRGSKTVKTEDDGEDFLFEEEGKEDEAIDEVLDQDIAPEFYTVKDGDTLYAIAKKFKTTVDKIKQLNNLKTNSIRKGQLLQVK